MGQHWRAALVGFLLPGILPAEPKLEKFFTQNCVKCHGPEKQKGKVRLDKPVGALFAEEELLETIATMLEDGEMPPWFYLPLHPEATLDATDLKTLRRFSEGR